MKHLRTATWILTTLCVLAGILACAAVSPRTDAIQTELKARAEEFWRLRLEGKHAEAYLFEIPAYREKTSLTIYVLAYAGSGSMLDAKVDSVSVDGDRGVAKVTIRHLIVGAFTPPQGLTRTIGDHWQRIDGQWFHDPNPPQPEKKKPATPPDYIKERELLGLPVPGQRPGQPSQPK